MAESGVPCCDVVSWQNVHAPAGTPRAIVDRLQLQIANVLLQPDIRQRLDAFGLEPSGMTSDQLLAFETAEREKWAKVVKAAGIRICASTPLPPGRVCLVDPQREACARSWRAPIARRTADAKGALTGNGDEIGRNPIKPRLPASSSSRCRTMTACAPPRV